MLKIYREENGFLMNKNYNQQIHAISLGYPRIISFENNYITEELLLQIAPKYANAYSINSIFENIRLQNNKKQIEPIFCSACKIQFYKLK